MFSSLNLLILLALAVWTVEAQFRREQTNKSYTYYECCGNVWTRRFRQRESAADREKTRACLRQYRCQQPVYSNTPASRRFRPFRPNQPPRPFENSRTRSNPDTNDPMDYSQLPAGYRRAFLSVDELNNNRDLIMPGGPNYRNTFIVFDNQTEAMYYPNLKGQVDDVLSQMVPGTWRSMTYMDGCCPVLRYHAANKTMRNIRGREQRIVHFDKYYPPMYQFIPHGICTGTFRNCRQGTVTMSLLVYDLSLNPPLSFDIFNVPSYCNCYNY